MSGQREASTFVVNSSQLRVRAQAFPFLFLKFKPMGFVRPNDVRQIINLTVLQVAPGYRAIRFRPGSVVFLACLVGQVDH